MNKIAVIGLGPMGVNLALNMKDHGFDVVGYNRSASKREAAESQGLTTIDSFDKLSSFFGDQTRVVWLMVAASAVDSVMEDIAQHLRPGDVIIEGGNSHFDLTDKRVQWAESKKLTFIGVGVSGGESGARYGPALMPGGTLDAYNKTESLFTTIAAKAPQDDKPCVSYIGPGGAGHFVKMVHNGIEYGIMALIGEVVWLLRDGFGLSVKDIGELFDTWNQPDDPLESYLSEITADLLQEPGKQGEDYLINNVGDYTAMKGTGMWTCNAANDALVAIPSIYAAVTSRLQSMRKELRLTLAQEKTSTTSISKEHLSKVHDALHLAIISCYAQGMDLIQTVSEQRKYDINLTNVAEGWRAGCIIRAPTLLQHIANASLAKHLLADEYISKQYAKNKQALQDVAGFALCQDIPTPVLDASYQYLRQLSSKTLFGNSVQALQRDYFGAHTYTRLDDNQALVGNPLTKYHTKWMDEKREEQEVTK